MPLHESSWRCTGCASVWLQISETPARETHCPFCGQISANTRSKVAANPLECEAPNKRGRAAETAGPLARKGGPPMHHEQSTAARPRASEKAA